MKWSFGCFQTMSARDICICSVSSAWAELGRGNVLCIIATAVGLVREEKQWGSPEMLEVHDNLCCRLIFS